MTWFVFLYVVYISAVVILDGYLEDYDKKYFIWVELSNWSVAGS